MFNVYYKRESDFIAVEDFMDEGYSNFSKGDSYYIVYICIKDFTSLDYIYDSEASYCSINILLIKLRTLVFIINCAVSPTPTLY